MIHFSVNDRETFIFTPVEKQEMWLQGKVPGGQSGAPRPSFCFCADQLSKLIKSLPSLGFRLLFWKNRMKAGSGVFVSGTPAPSRAGDPAQGPELVTHPSLAKSGRGWAGGGEGK